MIILITVLLIGLLITRESVKLYNHLELIQTRQHAHEVAIININKVEVEDLSEEDLLIMKRNEFDAKNASEYFQGLGISKGGA